MAEKINSTLKEKVLRVDVTKLEASLLRVIREVDYGQVRFVVHKIDGQPVRIEIEEVRKSNILDSNYGMDLEDCIYISPDEKKLI
ncbi:MAG: hypothetical protein BWY21_02070 [Parcubacteria group bacterium ADurb.Bin216]|nr:MAG: hypothetical protein BWY21_02070 [Parcubacteria group bacterium ADurb.Bin216]